MIAQLEMPTLLSGLEAPIANVLPLITLSSPKDEALTRQLRKYSQLCGLPFWCVAREPAGPRVIASSSHDLSVLPELMLNRFWEVSEPHMEVSESGITFYALPLRETGATRMIAFGWVRQRPDRRPNELVLAAMEAGWTKKQLDDWLNEQPYAAPSLVERLLKTTWLQVNSESQEQELRQELCSVAEQIDHTYEEITLLHALTGNLHLSRTPQELAEWCLSRVRELTNAEGAAIHFEDHNGESRFLTSGNVPFDEPALDRLCVRCEGRDWSKPFVKNRITDTALRQEMPELRNFVLCAIGDKLPRSGWLMHCNSPTVFGSVQASLLQSIARILGTHLQNRELFERNEELLTSFVRSMVSTIDAKDSYTRGHSERVALVARCLAQELGFPIEDVEDIYLSGLLHDIGKVGVDDRILRKEGRLNEEEFEQIMRHPEIGCHILSGLQNLQHVLPGVKHHHEAFDGSGYPSRLKGEDIPMMARVISVADSYDAMGSDRPYRQGLPLEQVEAIFLENAGPQWDPDIIAAYFRARVEIRKVWSAHRPTDLLSLSSSSGLGRSRFFLANNDVKR